MSMKHLLTATMIATALASPVRADDHRIRLDCAPIDNGIGRELIRFSIDQESWEAHVAVYVASALTLVASNERYTVWVDPLSSTNMDGEIDMSVDMYLLDRETMHLQQSTVSGFAINTFIERPWNPSSRFYHCGQPL